MAEQRAENSSIELCQPSASSECAEESSAIIQMASDTGTASEPFSRARDANSSPNQFGLPDYIAQRRGIRGCIRRLLWRHGLLVVRMYMTFWVAIIIVILLSVFCSIMGEGEEVVKRFLKASSSPKNSSTDLELHNNFP